MNRYPADEKETIILYQALEGLLGWRIVYLQRAFPDAVIENHRGRRLLAEFEFTARRFVGQGHNPAGCDLIICWQNDWPNAPVPVWALAELPANILDVGLRYLWLLNELREARLKVTALEEQIATLNAREKVWRGLSRRRAAEFWIRGIGEFYTDWPSHADRIGHFLAEVMRLPEVEEIRHRVATSAVLDALGKL